MKKLLRQPMQHIWGVIGVLGLLVLDVSAYWYSHEVELSFTGVEKTVSSSENKTTSQGIAIDYEDIHKILPPTPIVKENNWEEEWKVTKLDDNKTIVQYPEDERMSTEEELFEAVNEYRKAHNAAELATHDVLCQLAKDSVHRMASIQNIDDHEDLKNFTENQDYFLNVAELLYTGGQASLGVHLVEWGWGRSLGNEKEMMLNPKWDYGCAGIEGYYVKFLLGNKNPNSSTKDL